ncbi:MAG: hypothetical protein RLZZ495_471 [Pseudomonadota bacterium]
MKFPRTSGILLHPTSLPGSYGSGDLGAAAYHFVDWLQKAGQRLWQILPLGGIGPGNSPYMSSSAFAGNVLLIDLDDLRQQGWLTSDDLIPDAAFEDNRLNFAAVVPWRMNRLWRASQRFNADASECTPFIQFCTEHAHWLDDYALFMALAEHFDWQDWCDWPDGLSQRDPQAIANAAQCYQERIQFWKFCQWCFFTQWHRLRAYANAKQIQIVGDAPIFIAYQSAEVWARQDLFDLNPNGKPRVVAGVPPDYFSATGQRWGNPLYRWEQHTRDGFAWWIERIRHTLALVDIVRIDHFRGFAAYWEIPADAPNAIQGQWLPAPGLALFNAVQKALGDDLPIIAEDLGIITPDVEALRREFAFAGMRVLHFAFGGEAQDRSQNAFLPHNYEAETVVYTGTHDNDTTQGWWASATERKRAYVRDYLPSSSDATIHWDLIRAACASVANTAIYPMQDVLGLGTACRMNFPGHSEGYWEWRFRWEQVQPDHADRLLQWIRLFGRDARVFPS